MRRLLGGAAFALAQMAPRRYERLADAGAATGVIDPLLVRAYLHAGMALPAPTLRTARLRLRPFDDADADGLFALHSNARVLLVLEAIVQRRAVVRFRHLAFGHDVDDPRW